MHRRQVDTVRWSSPPTLRSLFPVLVLNLWNRSLLVTLLSPPTRIGSQSRGDAVTVSEVDQVARDTHLTSGKWKISVEAADLERTWGLIARAVHSGALGEACTSAKVSTTITQKLRARGSLHTVYVYTANYLDEQSVDQLRAGLQQLLLDGNAGASAATSTMAEFKPNIYTVMGWGDGRMPPLVPAARYTT